MNTIRFLTCLVLYFSSAYVFAGECNKQALISDINEKLASVTGYQMHAKIKIAGTEAKPESMIYGHQPNLLRIDYTVKQGDQQMKQQVIFDGRYQWMESKMGESLEVQRLDLSKATDSKRPFDSFLYVFGTGLLSGEDYPGTVRALLEVYDLEVECLAGDKVVLQGNIDKARFETYLKKSKYSKNRLAGVDRFVKDYGYVHMLFEDSLLKKYMLAADHSSFGFRASFYDVKINSSLNKALFEYQVPSGNEFIDVTPQILDATSLP